jgi:hypothetical protein
VRIGATSFRVVVEEARAILRAAAPLRRAGRLWASSALLTTATGLIDTYVEDVERRLVELKEKARIGRRPKPQQPV